MTENRVVAEGVHKAFGDNKVLKGVSFTVEQGTATAIIGPSGSGKTTLLRTLNALDRADAGVIRVDDIEIDFSTPTPKPEVRRFQSRSGFVFQNHNLFPHKTVLQNVTEGPVIVQKRPKAEAEAEAVTLLEQVGLAAKKDQYPYQLSGGQQQRVGIARSLASEPELWFLDEPFSALDPLIRREMQDEFLRLQSVLRKTIVFITHDFDEAIRLGDRIGIMKDGRLVQLATPEDMVSAPANDYVREFTRNAPRDRILTVGAVASPETVPVNGVNVLASAKIGDAAALVLSSDKAIAVLDDDGKPVGAIDRKRMIAALYPDGAR